LRGCGIGERAADDDLNQRVDDRDHREANEEREGCITARIAYFAGGKQDGFKTAISIDENERGFEPIGGGDGMGEGYGRDAAVDFHPD